jgi:hypothetical protein
MLCATCCAACNRPDASRTTDTNKRAAIDAQRPEDSHKSVQSKLREGFHSRSFAPSAIGYSPDEALEEGLQSIRSWCDSLETFVDCKSSTK